MAHKHLSLWFRPSRLLGLLLFGELGLFFSFALWQTEFPNRQMFGNSPPVLKIENWLFLIGVVSAITGWIVSSYITLRNSIKQHTINTLLQSRLSATYMQYASRINKSYFAPDAPSGPVPLESLLATDDESRENLAALNYVLNYFEFLAVGIRHGDLDRKVLKHTLRGILVRLYEKCECYIKYTRGDDGKTVAMPRQFEHVSWLYQDWCSKKHRGQMAKMGGSPAATSPVATKESEELAA